MSHLVPRHKAPCPLAEHTASAPAPGALSALDQLAGCLLGASPSSPSSRRFVPAARRSGEPPPKAAAPGRTGIRGGPQPGLAECHPLAGGFWFGGGGKWPAEIRARASRRDVGSSPGGAGGKGISLGELSVRLPPKTQQARLGAAGLQERSPPSGSQPALWRSPLRGRGRAPDWFVSYVKT